MKRQKFIKYLMGKGLPRNKANLMAHFLQDKKVPYNCLGGVHVVKLEKSTHYVHALIPWGYARALRTKTSYELEEGFSFELTPANERLIIGERNKPSKSELSDASTWWLRSPNVPCDTQPFGRVLMGEWVGLK